MRIELSRSTLSSIKIKRNVIFIEHLQRNIFMHPLLLKSCTFLSQMYSFVTNLSLI